MKKVGRNELCPCGSGKKFKNCHVGREDEVPVDGMSEFTVEMSARITGLPQVQYGRSREMVDALDLEKLTASSMGIKFIDLKQYHALNVFGHQPSPEGKDSIGGILVNPHKTVKTDPNNIYLAISPRIGEGALIHLLAHVLDDLAGSQLMHGLARPLSLEVGIPVEHLEHPREFGYWLDYLRNKFDVGLDADDTIIRYLFQNGMLIRGKDIKKMDPITLKSNSEATLKFLSERSTEIDALICERPGYVGSRVRKD